LRKSPISKEKKRWKTQEHCRTHPEILTPLTSEFQMYEKEKGKRKSKEVERVHRKFPELKDIVV
jgi:hypothetical protein